MTLGGGGEGKGGAARTNGQSPYIIITASTLVGLGFSIATEKS